MRIFALAVKFTVLNVDAVHVWTSDGHVNSSKVHYTCYYRAIGRAVVGEVN